MTDCYCICMRTRRDCLLSAHEALAGLMGKLVQEGLDDSLTAADMDACAAQVSFSSDGGELNTRANEVTAFLASSFCSTGPVTFFNGQTWTVPVGTKPSSSEYVRSPFEPQVRLSGETFAF